MKCSGSERPSGPAIENAWKLWSATASVFVVFFYLSLVVSLIVYLGWHDFVYFLGRAKMWRRFALTVECAVPATFLSMMIGVPAGYALSRLLRIDSSVLDTLVDLPVMMPPATTGFFLFGVTSLPPVRALLRGLGLRLQHEPAGMILVMFVVTVPFAVRLCKAAFDARDPRYEAVARTLGASRAAVFFTVALPMALRAVLGAGVVVWARAMAEWEGIMLFTGGVAGKTDVMPLAVYLDWNGGMMGWVASMSIVCMVVAFSAALTARYLGGKAW